MRKIFRIIMIIIFSALAVFLTYVLATRWDRKEKNTAKAQAEQATRYVTVSGYYEDEDYGDSNFIAIIEVNTDYKLTSGNFTQYLSDNGYSTEQDALVFEEFSKEGDAWYVETAIYEMDNYTYLALTYSNYVKYSAYCYIYTVYDGYTPTDDIYNDGYNSGYNDGYEEGLDADAYQEGYGNGYDNGYGAGVNEGYDNGYDAGVNEGYDNGYDAGVLDGAEGASAGVFFNHYITAEIKYLNDTTEYVRYITASENVQLPMSYNSVGFNQTRNEWEAWGITHYGEDTTLESVDLDIHFETPFNPLVVIFYIANTSDVLDAVIYDVNNNAYYGSWDRERTSSTYGIPLIYDISPTPNENTLVNTLSIHFGRATDTFSGTLYAPSSVYSAGYVDGYNTGYGDGTDDGYFQGVYHEREIVTPTSASYLAGYDAGAMSGVLEGTAAVSAAKSVFSTIYAILDVPLFAEWFTVGTILLIVVVLGLVKFILNLTQGG